MVWAPRTGLFLVPIYAIGKAGRTTLAAVDQE